MLLYDLLVYLLRFVGGIFQYLCNSDVDVCYGIVCNDYDARLFPWDVSEIRKVVFFLCKHGKFSL